MAKLILGLAGEMSSGKGTIASHICSEYKASTHRFSTIMRDVLDRLYLEQSRKNMQILSEILRKNYSEDIFAKSMFHDVEKDKHEIVVVDGVRRSEDIIHLRPLAHFKLIYVETDIRLRYERLIKRSENTDDSQKTFEEFEREHLADSELQIKDLKNYANYVVNNDGQYNDLHAQIEKIIKENL
jgi:uridine kinase